MKIAISGLSGVGSSTTAKQVAARLNLPMNNFTFRDLAKERGVAFEELQAQSMTDPSIDLELDRRLIEFLNTHPDCLSATDLSCWLDNPKIWQKLGLDGGPAFDLKIWLEAPLDVRAQRMLEREGKSLEEVITYNHQRDLDNRQRYQELYGVDIFDHSAIDWVFETSHLNLEQVVQQIVDTVQSLQHKQ